MLLRDSPNRPSRCPRANCCDSKRAKRKSHLLDNRGLELEIHPREHRVSEGGVHDTKMLIEQQCPKTHAY